MSPSFLNTFEEQFVISSSRSDRPILSCIFWMEPEFLDIQGGNFRLEFPIFNRGILVDVDPFVHFPTILRALQLSAWNFT